MPAVKRKFAAPVGILINSVSSVESSVASTGVNSGSFVISGGLGVGATSNFARNINLWNPNNTFYTGLVAGSTTTNTIYTLPINYPGTGTSVLQSDTSGSLTWVPMTATGSSLGTTAANINVVATGLNANHYILFSPTNGGSGVAVSSDAGLLFNPASNTLTTNTFTAGVSLNTVIASITGSTASTSTTTGTLVVTGGVGVGGSLNVASATAISGVTINNGIITGSLTGTATTSSNINVVLAGTSASHPLLFTPTSGTASGVAVSSNSTLVYNPSTDLLSVSGLAVTSGAGSSNATTGALVVTGGVGIGGSLNVTNKARFAEEVKLTSLSSNALSLDGSGSVAYTWTVGTTLTSSRYNLGSDLCLVPVGGSQSALQTFWGLQLVGNNQLTPTSYSPTAIGARDAIGVLVPNQQAASVAFGVIGHASQTGDLQIWTTPSGLATTTLLSVRSNGQLYSYVSIASTSPTTGALVVTGSVGIGQSVSLSGRLQMFNGANYTAFVSSASGSTVYTLPATSPATGSSVLQSTAGGVMSWVPMTAGSASGNTSQNIVINSAGNVNVFHPVLFTPSSLSAGSAVSSDSTISFNPSTEILNVSGLAITSGTASTNNVTGALIVRGGLGVSGQLSFVSASMGFTGISWNPSMAFIGNTSSSPITLTVLTDNSLNFEGSQGSVFAIDSNLSSGEIFSVSDISGLPIISASAGQTVNINEFGGYTLIGNGSINSSSTNTGSLVVSGGLGVTGNTFIGGTTTLTSLTNSTTTGSGSLVINGGLGVSGNANIGGTVRISNGQNSSSTTSGSLIVNGGVGITGNAFIGGTTTITNTTASTTSSSGALVVSGGVGIGNSISVAGRIQLFNGANYTAFVSSATGNTVYTLPATSPATGSSVLQSTAGGVMSWAAPSSLGNSSGGTTDGSVQYKSGGGFAATNSFFYDTALYALRLSNFPAGEPTSQTSAALKVEQTTGSFSGSINGTMIAVNANSGFTGDLLNLQTNAITKFRIDVNGAIGTSSDIVTVSTTAATNTTSGALQVRGGAGIAQTLFVGGNIVNSNYFYSGGNNFTKTGQAQGDIFLDNNTNDTPGLLYYYRNNTNFGIDAYAVGIGATRLRIVRDLNESTGAEIWSIDRTGVVTRSAWDVGEVINTRVYNNSDLGMSATTTINSTTYTNVATITYTPKSSTSHLWIEFDANYDYSNGTTTDDFFSRITVGGSAIVEKNQIMVGQVGGGTRSGVIFPISGRYTNSSTSGIAITVQARWGSADDAIRVYGSSTSGYMRIQEIGR